MPEGVPANESLMAYLSGAKDGVAKTPEWAEKITHVPAQTIRQLARDYATTKPAALIQWLGTAASQLRRAHRARLDDTGHADG